MKNIKLLKCPICGSEAHMNKFYESCDGRGDKAPSIYCNTCGLNISMSYDELWKLDEKFGHTGGYRSDNKELLDAMHNYLANKWNDRIEIYDKNKSVENDNKVTFNIKATMNERWVNDFCSMLACMERNGAVGHSSIVGFYADGDGDFRPKFEIDYEYEQVEGHWKKNNKYLPKIEVMFDAG